MNKVNINKIKILSFSVPFIFTYFLSPLLISILINTFDNSTYSFYKLLNDYYKYYFLSYRGIILMVCLVIFCCYIFKKNELKVDTKLVNDGITLGLVLCILMNTGIVEGIILPIILFGLSFLIFKKYGYSNKSKWVNKVSRIIGAILVVAGVFYIGSTILFINELGGGGSVFVFILPVGVILLLLSRFSDYKKVS